VKSDIRVKAILFVYFFLVFGVLSFGVSIVISNVKDRIYSGNLIDAINENDHEKLEYFLNKKADVNATPYSVFQSFFLEIFNDPPLFYAIRSGDVESVRLLLEHGADPNIITIDGYTPLEATAQSLNIERFDIANILLDYNADVDFIDQWGNKPALYFVVGYNRNDNYTKGYELFLRFLSLDAIPDSSQEFYYGNYLLYAVSTNNVLIVDYLINFMNYDMLSIGKDGASALIRAVQYKAVLVVEYLIENGADVSYQDSFNKSALDYAVEKNFIDMISLLEE
jgi:uncharacterized protein